MHAMRWSTATYNESEDNVAQVALLTGHCAAGLLLLVLRLGV